MQRGAIALTDQDWFEFLRKEEFGEVINFWTPTPWRIRQLTNGNRFCFFLKMIGKVNKWFYSKVYHHKYVV